MRSLVMIAILALATANVTGAQAGPGAVDLTSVVPSCGKSPAVGKDMMAFASLVLGRAAAWPNSENLKWVAAIKKATAESPTSEIGFASVFAQRLNIVFDGDGGLQTSSKLLKRLDTLTPAEADAWSVGLASSTGSSISKIDAALAAVCVDRLFPDDRWNVGRSSVLHKRLLQLKPDTVSAFAASSAYFDAKRVPTDAPMALILADQLFPAELFSAEIFQTAIRKQ